MRATSIITLITVPLLCLSACNRQQETSPVRKTLQQAVFASGHLEQANESVLAATADGTITELSIREGDAVRPGQMLVRIKSEVQHTQLQEARLVYEDARQNAAPGAPQLAQIRAQINIAEAQRDQDKLNYERYTALRSRNSVSQLEYEKAALQYHTSRSNLQALEKNYRQVQDALRLNADRSLQQLKTQQSILNEYILNADKAGVVLDVLKKKGELVRKGELIARIGSGRHILKLFIAEEDITRLQPGQTAVVQLNNYPDTTFTALLTRILPAFDQAEQSYVAEAEFTTPPALLLSGTRLQANIRQEGTLSALVIPSEALIRGQFVQLKDGTEKAIRTGRKLGSWIEVKAGLTEQDVILLPKGQNKSQGAPMPGTE